MKRAQAIADHLPEDGREARGLRTRQAIVRAALQLMEGDASFSALSLREVAREAGIVPTAFYRHFRDMKELGLTLVDEAMRTLREMIRAARAQPLQPEHVIRQSVQILVDHVRAHRTHFRFITRELYAGRSAMRQAVRNEIRLFVSELATDLGRFPYLNKWSGDDLRMIAALFVNAMVAIAEAVADVPPNRPDLDAEVQRTAEKQLRLIALGVPHWKSA